jgi:hypothetical protein
MFWERILFVTGLGVGAAIKPVPPLREPTRSQEVNAKKKGGLASVGMTIWVVGLRKDAGKMPALRGRTAKAIF